MGVPASVSVTVAVHVAVVPISTGVSHATDIDVRRAVPLICVEPVLAACCASPP